MDSVSLSPRVKRPERGFDHLLRLTVRLKKD